MRHLSLQADPWPRRATRPRCRRWIGRGQFHADPPNPLRVCDYTDVTTRQDFVWVVFVIDIYARCIAGWSA